MVKQMAQQIDGSGLCIETSHHCHHTPRSAQAAAQHISSRQ